MDLTKEDVLNDPKFYRNPPHVQTEILATVDPKFAALDSENRQLAILGINSDFMDKNVSRAGQTGESMLPEGRLDPAGVNRVIKGESMVPKSEPSALQKFSLSTVPTNVALGVAAAPGAAYHLVADPIKAYQLIAPKPLTEEQNAAAIKKIQKEGPGFKRLGPEVLPAFKEYAQGAANNLTWGALGNLLPPPENEKLAAARTLGETTGGLISGKAGYDVFKGAIGKALANRAGQTFLGAGAPALARLALPTAMGATPGLAQGDIPAAIQGATTGLTLGGATNLATSIGRPVVEHFSPEQRALRARSKELGGGQGILNEVNKQIVESKTPGLSEAGYEVPASVLEGAQTIQGGGPIAGDLARARMTDRLNNEVRPLAPADFTVPSSHIEQFRTLATEGPEAFRNSVQRKLAKLTEELGPKPESGGARSAWEQSAADILKKAKISDEVRSKLAKDAAAIAGGVDDKTVKGVKNLFENTEAGQNPSTFSNLLDLYKELGRVAAPDDFSVRYIELAKEAVVADLNTVGKTYPDAIRAWKMWNKDYARDVGQYHGERAPLRKLYDTNYGTPEQPASTMIAKLVSGTEEQARNVVEGMRAGPHGPAAVDNISASTWQHLLEKHSTEVGTTDLLGLVKELSNPPRRRVLETLLGPRFDSIMNLRKALIDTGLHTYKGEPGAVAVWEGFHTVRGLFKLATGNITGAAYHLGTAGQMQLNAGMVARMANNKMGAKLLAQGLLEKPGTRRAQIIVDKLGKMAEDLGGEQGTPIRGAQDISEADIVPKPGSNLLREPVIPQGPPPGIPQLLPPGPGNRPAPVAPVLPEAVRAPAARSAEVFKNEPLTAKMQKAEQDYLKAQPNSKEGIDALKRSLRAQQALGQKYPDMDMATEGILSKFQDTPPNALERQQLQMLVADESTTPNVKDAAAAVLRKEYPAEVQYNLAPGERHPADLIRERNKANEALRNKGPKTVNEAEISPVKLMDRITKGGQNKIVVSPAEMREMRNSFNSKEFGNKADQWFTDRAGENTQRLEDVTGLYSNHFGIDDTYNAYKALLEDSYNAQTKKSRKAHRYK